MMNNIEKVLAEKGICVTTTKGDSMNPMLVEGRDKVVVVTPKFPLKKYDVPVYRKMGHYTMHRIVKVTKNGYIICGDNRGTLEKNVKESDIIGVLNGFYQGDKFISNDDREFIQYGKRAVRGLPLRMLKNFFSRAVRKIKQIIKKQRRR